MRNTINLSRLMRISWEIQRRKHKTRSKALTAAWTILNNEDNVAIPHTKAEPSKTAATTH